MQHGWKGTEMRHECWLETLRGDTYENTLA